MQKLFSGLALFLIVLAWSCGSNKPMDATKTPNYFRLLTSGSDFDSLSGEPLSAKHSRVSTVKVVWKVNEKGIYFIQSKYYNYHSDFCNAQFNSWETLETFNAANYHTNILQKYCLGNLNFYSDLNVYTLELTASTEYDTDQIEEFFNQVKSSMTFPSDLRLSISTDYLIEKESELEVPKISTSELYGQLKFQSIRSGKVYGRLVVLDSLTKNSDVTPTDIILIHGSPLEIPLCRAIVSDAFQTPLSHIQILSRSRGIPSCAILNKSELDELMALKDQYIELNISNDGFSLRKLEEAEWIKYAAMEKPAPRLLTYSLDKELLSGKDLDLKSKKFVGNKAAAFGELAQLGRKNKSSFTTPEDAFAIPFYYFNDHLKRYGIINDVIKLNKIQDPYSEREKVDSLLKSIRKSIKQYEVRVELHRNVEERLNKSTFSSFRFRSSSNAEDIDGFSGAGLYTSKTYVKGDSVKTIDRAIKAVWASVFNDQAYYERWSKGFDLTTVQMGILVHRSFPDEEVNGVVISSNIYRPSFIGITVNLQKGDEDVVSPTNGNTTEQVILMDGGQFLNGKEKVGCDYISMSNLNNYQPLLSKEQYMNLYYAITKIKERFYFSNFGDDNKGYNNYSLDIEFKFDKNGKLYIKQIRPA
jgi:hypothetical protein